MTHDTFAPHVNSKFRVLLDDGAVVELEMVETSELTTVPTQERFSLEFKGALDQALTQGTYRFSHETLGDFDLFIVPIRQDEEGLYYDAAFNRTRKP